MFELDVSQVIVFMIESYLKFLDGVLGVFGVRGLDRIFESTDEFGQLNLVRAGVLNNMRH